MPGSEKNGLTVVNGGQKKKMAWVVGEEEEEEDSESDSGSGSDGEVEGKGKGKAVGNGGKEIKSLW